MLPSATASKLTHLVSALALAISLLPALGYFLVQREGVVHNLIASAKTQSVLVTEVVGHNIKIWPSAHERLLEAIMPVVEPQHATLILYGQTRLISGPYADLRWPTIAREAEFFDFGMPAGRVRVVASLADILLQSAMILVLSLVLAIAVFIPLRQMSVRALKRASELLVRGELHRSLVDGLSEGVLLCDERLQIIATNRSARHIAGVAHPLLVEANLADCLRGATREDGSPMPLSEWPMRRCLQPDAPDGPVIMGMLDPLRGQIWLSLKSSAIQHGEQNEHTAVVTTIEDVTAQKRNADRLIITEYAVHCARDAIIITDAKARIIQVNDAFCRLTGYPREQVLGQTPSILRSGHHEPAFYRAMWAQIEQTGAWSGEIWNRARDGRTFPAWLSISEVRDGKNRLTSYIGTSFDLSERMAAEQQVRHLARHDPLTGLPNRSYLREALGKALAAAERHDWRVGVYFIDLDHFKLINDSMGHHAGDQVLAEVARRLTSVLREEDTVGRLAGDEFVVFSTKVDTDGGLVTVAEAILQALAAPIVLNGKELFLTTSVGIVVYPQDGRDVDTLLSNADTAMYAAKGDGRANFKFFTEEMNEASRHQLDTTNAVRMALEQGEFVLFYQPQVLAGDGEQIIGAEALIRWQRPGVGLIPPGQFIPVIEGSRLIIELGNWVIEEALRKAHAWQSLGFTICISVNVSPLQFRQENFLSQLQEAAARHAFVAGSLRLEVTESLMLTEPEATIAKMHQLRKLGFLLTVDDFGTGYSSLAYLARFPFDELKIDRSFIHRLSQDDSAKAIVNAIIVLSHALGLKSVAEGVESQTQAEILRSLGCDSIQGYLYGRPLPVEEFERRVRNSLHGNLAAPHAKAAALPHPGLLLVKAAESSPSQ